MNPRLKRPLLAAVISGALVASGVVYSAPVYAGTSSVGTVLADVDPTGTATPTDTATTTTPATTAPTTTAATTEPTTAPTTTAATTEPTTAPTTTAATTEPTTAPTTTAATTAPTTTPATTTPTAVPDTTAPTGQFRINSFYLWTGQKVLLTPLNIADNGIADPATVGRVVNWGDGTSTRIYRGWVNIPHQYTRAGHFPITMTLTDQAGNAGAVKSSGPIVSVPAAKYKLNRYTVWPGQSFTMAVSGVPSGTTKITVDWGDGYAGTYPGRNATINGGYYYHRRNGGLIRGAVTIRVAYTNKFGISSWINAARVTVRTDSVKPTVKVSKPSQSYKASSWKYVRGTVADKGAGAPYVYVWVMRITGKKVYCFTQKKKWLRVYSQTQIENNCWGVPVKASKGKWSLKLGGVQKGTLYIDARAWDWADNASKWSSVKVKITR
ncbi:hypothetical protein ACWKSP_33025 [Micromonosporaceae bacterium Da 78-11]